MLHAKVYAVLFVGLLALTAGRSANAGPASAASAGATQVQWSGPGYGQDWQGHREHCDRMRYRLHEIRDRIGYVSPWQRQELERRAFDLRERLRAECWGR